MKQNKQRPPIIAIAGFSGNGKTTLITHLLAGLTHLKITCATIKHAHHQFDIDKPGKDSYAMRQAGAKQVLLASKSRWALMTEIDSDAVKSEPDLFYLIEQLDYSNLDLILVEGFKHEAIPKLEIARINKPELYLTDNNVIAVICPAQTQLPASMPRFEAHEHQAILDFILKVCQLK